MTSFIVKVTYRVETEGIPELDTVENMEAVEAQRWQMFQGKYSVAPLKLTVEKV